MIVEPRINERSAVIYTVTMDGGLMRERTLAPAVVTLKNWQTQGLIQIHETDRSDGRVVQPPQPAQKKGPWSNRRPGSKKDSPTFARMSSVVFPMRDTHKLNMTELNSVNHLVRHLDLGRSYFITRDPIFAGADSKKRLKESFQITVMTPEEIVEYLSKTEGWKP